MGGGDLNTKKSWHPSTLKNQERVWKAEQAAACEKRRISDLRREIDEERSREGLVALGQSSGTLKDSGDKLDWMYKGPHETVDREEYLLGKKVDKNYEKLSIEEQQSKATSYSVPKKNHVEHECIPFSIRNFRGDSLGSKEIQVDMARKIMEDPLVAIKKRELESRAQLLQNPVKLKELTRLLREDHDKKKRKKDEKKKKKKNFDLDLKLAEKLKSLKNKDNIDIDFLLSSKRKTSRIKAKQIKREKYKSESSDESDSENESSRSKKELKKSSKTKDRNSNVLSNNDKYLYDSDSAGEGRSNERKSKKHSTSDKISRDNNHSRKDKHSKHSKHQKNYDKYYQKTEHKDNYEKDHRSHKNKESSKNILKRKQSYDSDEGKGKHKKYSDELDHTKVKKNYGSSISNRGDVPAEISHRKNYGLTRADGSKVDLKASSDYDRTVDKAISNKQLNDKKVWKKPEQNQLTKVEKEARLKEMIENASKRDKERENNISRYREQDKRQAKRDQVDEYDKSFIEKQLRKTANLESVESRIKSNINNIQRSRRDMDTNFAKR